MKHGSGLLFLLIACAAGFSGCSAGSNAATTPESNGVSIGVKVVEVSRGDILSAVDAVGTLQAVQEATLSSRVSGRIAELTADLGDEVEADALLVELDQEEFVLAVRQARAALEAAQARRAGAKLTFNRVAELRKQNIASPDQLDTAENAVDVAEAVVKEAQAALALAQDNLEHATVTAPFPAKVSRRFVNEGERVSPGQPLLHLVNLDTVEVDVTVSERRLAELAAGQPVAVSVDGYPGQVFTGQVYRIAPTVDPVTRTVTATIQLPNPGHELRPGMFARVEIHVGKHENTRVVPRTGLLERGGELWAVRVEDGRAERVRVTAGYRYRDRVEVLDGLEVGDQVVTEGAYGIGQGAAVHIVSEDATG